MSEADPLVDFIMRMKSLGTLDEDLARAAAPELELAAKANVAAGLDPEGHAWPAKKDGSAPLKNAAAAVTCTAEGAFAVLEVGGVEAIHQKLKEGGTHPRRKLIPEPGDPLPPYLVDALDRVAGAEIARRLG